MGKKFRSIMLSLLFVLAFLAMNVSVVHAAEQLKITKQPVTAVAPKGSDATVSFKATGEGLTYKWYYKNEGASSFKLTTTFSGNKYTAEMSDSRDGRQVYCVVTDKNGKSVKTNTVTLHMGKPLKITKQPVTAVAKKGDTATVSFTATGDGLKYKWYYKNKGASSFKSTSTFSGNKYTADMNSTRDGRQVYCVVTDKYGVSVKTKTVTLHMGNPLKVTKQPVSVTTPKGTTAKVTIGASGDGLTYKWYYKNKGESKFTVTDTFKGKTYSVKMNSTRNMRQIYCKITDKYGVSVKTDIVTLAMGNPLKITTQPKSVSANEKTTAKVTFKASGDGLKYKWYYKDAGASKFKATDTFSGNTYTAEMVEKRSGRQIYCKVTDKYGNTVNTDTVTLTMLHVMSGWQVTREATCASEGAEKNTCSVCGYSEVRTIAKLKAKYSISADMGYGNSNIYGVPSSGKYTINTPYREGYVFKEWRLGSTTGSVFPSTGTVNKDVKIFAIWEVADTTSLTKLIKRAETGAEEIRIAADIVVDEPIFISYNTKIYADGDYTIKRAPKYAGDIFVVGQNEKGQTSLQMNRDAVLTLGGGKGTLTIDGNKDKITVTVKGSAVFVSDSATVNIYDGVHITNNKKLENERLHNYAHLTSLAQTSRAGGAAILSYNSTVNMYGGLIDNNVVGTEWKPFTYDDGTQSNIEYAGCGGAIYNRGLFNMYGGKIATSEGLRGGAVYSDRYTFLYEGEISDSIATSYGGAFASSSTMNADTFIGAANSEGTMVFKNNYCKGTGGALYSNTSSPITIYGNTVFEGNKTDSSGGAIYTAGPLVIRGATFKNNASVSSGGAIYHHYTKGEFNRRLFELENTTFEGNEGCLGGAVILSSTGTALETGLGTYASITDCNFVANHAIKNEVNNGNGGAIYITKKSDADIVGCTFEKNTAFTNGGAICTQDGTTVNATDCTFTENEAQLGGGMYAYTDAVVKLNGLDFTGNKAIASASGSNGNGGGLYSYGTKLSMKDVDFYNNSAAGNAGGIYQGYIDINLDESCEFIGNTAGKHGGAIYLTYKNNSDGTKDGAVLNASKVLFQDNVAVGGGAVSIRTSCEATFDGATFTGNTVTGSDGNNDGNAEGGGAIYVGYGKLTLNNVTADGNKATHDAQATEAKAKNDFGGVVNAVKSPVTITGGTFTNNESSSGGVLYSREGSNIVVSGATFNTNKSLNKNTGYDTTIGGGAFNVYKGSLTISESTFDGNTSANYAGTIHARGATVLIDKNTVVKNSEGNTGGALYFTSTCNTTMEDVTVLDNKSNSNGVIYANGGTLTMNNVSATGNSAAKGGVLYTSGASTQVTLNDSTWNKNSATNGGTAFVSNATFTIHNSVMNENTARLAGAVYIEKGNVVVDGATFDSNKATKTSSGGSGNGGAFCMSGGNLTIAEGTNAFTNNTAENHAGAIYVSYKNDEVKSTDETGNEVTTTVRVPATLNMIGGTFDRNSAMGGGAVSVRSDCKAAFEGTTFTNNSVTGYADKEDGDGEGGGAIYIGYAENLTLKDATFTGNTASGHGGAVDVVSTEATISGGTFENNAAGTGGAICSITNSKVNIDGTTFKNNESTISNGSQIGGGAVYTKSGTLTVNNTVMDGNKTAYYGGAIHAIKSTVDIDGSEFKNTTGGSTGGTLYFREKTNVTMDDTLVTNNTAKSNGNIYINTGSLTMKNVTATGNTATNGGTLFVSDGSTVVTLNDSTWSGNTGSTGGAINMSDGSVTILNSELNENSANNGGAIYNSKGKLSFSEVTFNKNNASNNGGAIGLVGANLTLTDGKYTFTENSAANHGGAIYVVYWSDPNKVQANVPSILSMTGGTFENNSALGGGAVSARTDCEAHFDGTTFIGNSVEGTKDEDGTADGNGEGGGAIYVGYGEVTLKDVTATGNKASDFGGFVNAVDSPVTVSGGTYNENTAVTGGAFHIREGANLSVTGAKLNKNEATGEGGAIQMSGTAVVITDSEMNENSANNGGAIYNYKGNLSFTGLTFDGNKATTNGGAIYLNGANLTLTDDTIAFANNTAGNHGGAVYVSYVSGGEGNPNIPSILTMTGGTFENNSALGGGAVSARTGCEAHFDGTTFIGNSVEGYSNTNEGDGEGGGAIYVGYGTLTLKDVIATGNKATDFGGFVNTVKSPTTIADGTFSNNEASSGGAIHSRGGSTVTITGTTFAGNKSTNPNTDYDSTIGGGAINAKGGTLTLIDVTMDGNTSANYGGAIHASKTTVTLNEDTVVTNSTGNTGGALYLRDGCTSILDGISITNNISNSNGVVYANGGSITVKDVNATGNKANCGGVLYVSGGTTVATLENNNWSMNSAKEGGAVYIKEASAEVKDCTFAENSSTSKGGVFYVGGGADVSVIKSEFNKNSSPLGGVIYVTEAEVTLSENTFTGNSATNNGGAIDTVGGTVTTTGDNVFTDNTAAGHGGAIYVAYHTLEDGTKVPGVIVMTGDTLENNEAAVAGGAISARTASQVTIADTTFKGNAANSVNAGEGGGAIFLNDNSATVSNSIFENNSTGFYGGGITALNANVTINENSVFTGNKGATGLALEFRNGGTYTLTDVVVKDNVDTAGGNGSIYITSNGTMNVTNLTATGNKNSNGGVFYVSSSAKVNIENSVLSGNTATGNGGAIDSRTSGGVTLVNTTISDNTAANGGAIHSTGAAAKVTVDDNTVLTGNTATKGGAIYLDLGATAIVNKATLDGNKATGGDGGAILVNDTTKEGDPAATTLVMTGTTLKNNTASSKGGAISTDTGSTALVINATDCTFTSNSALGAGGGAVEIQNGNCPTADDPTELKIVFKNCAFDANTAKTTGGAIEVRTSSCAKIDGITATGNKASGNGGVIYLTSNYSRLYLTGDVSLSGNTAGNGTFAYLYNNNYTNPPMIYTTDSNSAVWCSELGGNTSSVTYDMTTMP